MIRSGVKNINSLIQLAILKNLLFLPEARFSNLNTEDLTNDHFSYHLRQLVKEGWVVKNEDRYQLTVEGLRFAADMDLAQPEEFNPLLVGVEIYVEKIVGKEKFILLERRKRNPNKGLVGFHTTKVRLGESVPETAKRCLLEETGLTGTFKSLGCVHKRYWEEKNTAARLMVLLKAIKISGELLVETTESTNMWVRIKEVEKLENRQRDLLEDIKLFCGKKGFFEERELR